MYYSKLFEMLVFSDMGPLNLGSQTTVVVSVRLVCFSCGCECKSHIFTLLKQTNAKMDHVQCLMASTHCTISGWSQTKDDTNHVESITIPTEMAC